MKRLLILLAVSFVTILAGSTAFAGAVAIDPATVPQWTGTQTSEAAILAAILPITGTTNVLYKADVGDEDNPATVESGAFAGSYGTSFFNDPLDPEDAKIVWDGSPDPFIDPAVYGQIWLLVKDGAQTPAWYLFNLTTLGWNGQGDITLTDFWPGGGAISHVSIIGKVSVAEPATLSLLGLALCAVGWISRRRD